MTARARIRQDDVRRAVAGAIAGGMSVDRVEIEPDGRIVLIARDHTIENPKEDWPDDDY